MEQGAGPRHSAPARGRLELLEDRVESLGAGLTARLDRVLETLAFLVDDDPRARRRLAELRTSSEYEKSYTESAPLVSVLIPTWNRTESLTTRAIPSVLSQSHANIEAVVVGDCSPPDLAGAVAAIADPRVRFHNLSIRGPYDPDPHRAWCASGTPALNAALALARGRWITALGDDDEFPAEHIETLLGFARAQHLEFAYGWLRFIDPDGGTRRVGSFPPAHGYINLQVSLWHAGLRFLEFELAHALFDVPNDWGLISRMMRIGVSIGQTDEVLLDYVPSGRHASRDLRPQPDETHQLRRQLADLHAERELLEARLADYERRIDELRASRSWRMTAPLRGSAQAYRLLQGKRR
jgi:hypothetical protein